MKDVNLERVLKDLGEEAILEQWEKDTHSHSFSLDYKRKKTSLDKGTQNVVKKC